MSLCRCWSEGDPVSPAKADKNVTLDSGMVRSNDTGKPDYTTIDPAMLERWARHMTANISDKGHNNWRLASTDEDRQRFLQSAWRHFLAWASGVDDGEDHAAALFFNVAGAEYVKEATGG